MQDPLLFALAVLALLGTPGPTNTLLATSGASVGFRRSLPLIGAEMGGYFIAVAILHLLLGPILGAHPTLNAAVRLAVGAYLLMVAVQLWRRREGFARGETVIGFRKVFVTTLLNPKAAVFAFAVLPLSQPAPWPYLLAFAGFIVAAAGGWILLGAAIGEFGDDRARRSVAKVAAVALACFAGLIATG